MKFLTVEVNTTGNAPAEPTETIGLGLENIYDIGKSGDFDIYFNFDGTDQYTKTFKTKEERDNYFDYIGSKLEVINASPDNNLQVQGA